MDLMDSLSRCLAEVIVIKQVVVLYYAKVCVE